MIRDFLFISLINPISNYVRKKCINVLYAEMRNGPIRLVTSSELVLTYQIPRLSCFPYALLICHSVGVDV